MNIEIKRRQPPSHIAAIILAVVAGYDLYKDGEYLSTGVDYILLGVAAFLLLFIS